MMKERMEVIFKECSKEELIKLGECLRDMRKGENISQQALSEKSRRDRSSISKFELGQAMPTVQALNDMASALGYEMKLTFEKKDKGLFNASKIPGISESKRRICLLGEALRAYSDALKPEYCDQDEVIYFKNRLNYSYNIVLPYDREDDAIIIHMDNSEAEHEYSPDWDRGMYIRVTVEGECYKADLIKEYVFVDELIPKTINVWSLKNPREVIVAAENIRKYILETNDWNNKEKDGFGRLEVIDKECLINIDISNKETLKVDFKQRDDSKFEEKCLYKLKIIAEIEKYNDQVEQDKIEYDFGYRGTNDYSDMTLIIKLKDFEFRCDRTTKEYRYVGLSDAWTGFKYKKTAREVVEFIANEVDELVAGMRNERS